MPGHLSWHLACIFWPKRQVACSVASLAGSTVHDSRFDIEGFLAGWVRSHPDGLRQGEGEGEGRHRKRLSPAV